MNELTYHVESQDVQGRKPGKLAVIAPRLERIKLEEIISEWTEKSGADIYFGIRCHDTLERAHIEFSDDRQYRPWLDAIGGRFQSRVN